MMLYKIALSIFIFAAVCTGINDSGIFTITVPESNVNQMEQADVQDLTDTASGEVTGLFTIGFVIVAIKSIIAGLVAIFSILPLLTSWGVPLWIGMIFQAPLWFVEAVGIYQFVTGVNVEG
jgi:hypothetical protein